MRFLIDAQLPPALARWVVAQGHAAEHVADCGLAESSDGEIWDYAVRAKAVIVTKDQDFARRKTLSQQGPRIVWIRLPNTRRRELLAAFERVAPALLAALERGEEVVELV
jgi:predicted nuclease of predicted toxin-antitoxin system